VADPVIPRQSHLTALSPCAGMLPLAIGGITLTEVDPGHLTAIAPRRGSDLASALKAAHGLDLPGPGQSTGDDTARVLWFGRAHVVLMGPPPDPALAAQAALTDISDGWAVVRLEGAGAVQVLARLTPLDLRPRSLAIGQTARTELFHMQSAITRLSDEGFLIMVFRSMSQTLVHDLMIAMEGVAARLGA
jgi:heterotetrameric sarcosine oxidase gamma subunit